MEIPCGGCESLKVAILMEVSIIGVIFVSDDIPFNYNIDDLRIDLIVLYQCDCLE